MLLSDITVVLDILLQLLRLVPEDSGSALSAEAILLKYADPRIPSLTSSPVLVVYSLAFCSTTSYG